MEKTNKEYLDIIDSAYNENKIVFMTVDGLMSVDIDEFIKQPVEGILYDLNRDGATIRTLAESSKNIRWINDLAFSNVFKIVFNKYKAIEKENNELKAKLNENVQEDKIIDTMEPIINNKQSVSTNNGYTEWFDSDIVFTM